MRLEPPERTREYRNHHLDSTRCNQFVPRDDDIFVTTAYKAGTTWTQRILAALILGPGPLRARLSEISRWIDARFVGPLQPILDRLEAQRHRRFMKSHLAAEVTDPFNAYQLAKRANSLRVMAEAVRWGKRGARINTISPGIIFTPLARDELTGPRGEGYGRMIELCPAGRGGTPDEVGAVGALLMGPEGAFITGSDFLMDGGVTASYFSGDLAPSD
jgi:NAD(P)-dependent dehydrogenase (short-subunit alcohol dehydrogenase family)